MTKPPNCYYVVSGVLTFWALVGCYSYIAQVTMLPVIQTIGFAEGAGFPIFIAVVGAISLWFARMARARGWLR